MPLENSVSADQNEKSIAVLPFANFSNDEENEYFADGFTEEVINVLTTIKGLKVIARTSSFAFKGKNIDIRTIGEQLGVNTILEGSIRKAKNRIRITAQLVSAIDGTHYWSKNFDRDLENIFEVQDEISLLIADKIRENFGHFNIPTFPSNSPTTKIAAYDLWLKGSYHLKRKEFDDIKKAITLFKEAIEVDPNYTEAYSTLGEAYLHAAGFGIMATQEAYVLAKETVTKAIGLDAKNAYAHKVLAYINLFYDWEWEQAISAYDKAIAYGLPEQNEFISYYYIFIKEDFERAIEVAHNVIETDPLHVISHWQLGLTYYFARKFKEASIAFSSALEIDPDFSEAFRFRGLVKAYLGKFKEALRDIQQSLDLTGGQGLANIDLLVVKILMGKQKEVMTVVEQSTYIDASDPAFLYAMLNEPDKAFEWLNKAFEERSVMLVTLKNFWVWDNLREDQRFKDIYDRMNFPASIVNKAKQDPINTAQVNTKSTSLLQTHEIENYLQALDEVISKEDVYTDPSLSLRLLAEKIALHPNKLSWLLNEELKKNFNEYINAYRLSAFKTKALDEKNAHITLLGLAYESGFNSKTSFNNYFKKVEGVTPREWVKTHKK